MSGTFDLLWQTIEARKANPPPGSYTARLFSEGVPRIARKVGEEGVETVVAALNESDERLISEMADLMYHCLVLLAARDLSLDRLETELAGRFKAIPASDPKAD